MDRSSTVFSALREPQNKGTLRTIAAASVLMFVLPLGLFFVARNVLEWGDGISAALAVIMAQIVMMEAFWS